MTGEQFSLTRDATLDNDLWFFIEGIAADKCESGSPQKCGGRCRVCYARSLVSRWADMIQESRTKSSANN